MPSNNGYVHCIHTAGDDYTMMSKEDYYKLITEIRTVVDNPANTRCTCPNTYCEWYGDCRKCVAQHRYYGNHIPACLPPITNTLLS